MMAVVAVERDGRAKARKGRTNSERTIAGALRDKERRLARYQRRMSRRVKGGKRRERAKAQAARLHQRIALARCDHAHKATTAIVARAQTIKVETLDVAGWMKNRHLAKSAADASVGMFLTMLRYKAQAAGRTLVEVGRWEPTSKTCSACGAHEPGVVLGVGRWTCRECGVIHDRDHNAARNIFAYGEERRNVARIGTETRRESGEQDGASPAPVPDDELGILKRTEQGAAHVLV